MNTILGMPVVVFGVIAQLVGMAVCTVGIEPFQTLPDSPFPEFIPYW
jgi:hypothetical protein